MKKCLVFHGLECAGFREQGVGLEDVDMSEGSSAQKFVVEQFQLSSFLLRVLKFWSRP